jgi:LPS export ABC transporter protein LptC
MIIKKRYRYGGILPLLCSLLIAACSFNYDTAPKNDNGPNLIITNAEYIRITNGNPEIHLKAGEIRQFESKHIMELDDFSFEQYNPAPVYSAETLQGRGSPTEGQEAIPDINTRGRAGFAQIETDTSNFNMKNDVSIEVKSEDISLETAEITWQDKERLLGAPGQVEIKRTNGTTLKGTNFSANARDRSWKFESGIEGSIVEDDKNDPNS